jgi:hypothetical protein
LWVLILPENLIGFWIADDPGVKRTSGAWLLGFFEKLCCKPHGGHCIRPTGIERQMSDSLDQLFLFDSVLHGFAEMEGWKRSWSGRCKAISAATVIRLRSRLDNSLRSHTSSNNTRSVSFNQLGRKVADQFLGCI